MSLPHWRPVAEPWLGWLTASDNGGRGFLRRESRIGAAEPVLELPCLDGRRESAAFVAFPAGKYEDWIRLLFPSRLRRGRMRMSKRGTAKVVAAVVVTAICGALGYATAGVAATQSVTKTSPLSPAVLAQIEADIHTAMTLELRAISDIKKATPATNKNLLVAMRRAKEHLVAASTALVAAGFRTSPPYNPISNAGNAVNSAVSSHQAAKYRIAALHAAIAFETKSLAGLPALATVPPTTTSTTTTARTTTPTTTSG